MKRYLYILSAISAAFIIGCGESSSVSDQQFSYDTSSIFGFSKEITYKDYLVEAVDDPILKATVTATNCEDFEEIGDGKYLLKKCIGKPTLIEVKNGIIVYKDKNVTQDFPLLLNVAQTNKDDDFIVTPLTTILVNADENNITTLADKLGVSEDELFSAKNNIKSLLPKINSVLILSASQGAITNKIKFLDVVREEIINNIQNGDINISKTVDAVSKKSLDNPNLFGLVIISTTVNEIDPLEELAKLQNANSVKFYGLVFDSKISDANVTIKNLDTNETYQINASSDENGFWSFEVNESTNPNLYNVINDENNTYLLQFTAIKNENKKTIKLTSTITTKKLRTLLTNNKIISPSKDNSLIISNVTTAQDAILDKKGALNSSSYDGNVSELRVYYQDKLLTAAAMIKAVVDNNATVNTKVNNTYDLVKESISDIQNLDVNTSVVEANISEIENNITNDTILSSQLNNIEVTNEKKDEFQTIAENAGYVFYRLLAYYKEGKPHIEENFVREYTKIIVYPGYYETKTCDLEGNSTNDWNCSNSYIIENSSNFTLGQYEVDLNNSVINYSLDFNSSFYVEDLNKNYNYYGVIKSETNLTTGITFTEPMILVDSYDVVDAFRRMPVDDKDNFNELQNLVKDSDTKKDANFVINRWIKNNFINTVGDYFDNNTTK